MEFVKEYVFYNINIEDVDETIVKACSECSYKNIHSYNLHLIFNVNIINKEDNKTKNKVIKYTSCGGSYFCIEREKRDIK